MRVRTRRLLDGDYGDKVTNFRSCSSTFWGYNRDEINNESHKKYIELINIIEKKYGVGVYGRSKVLTNYDFIVVESLPTNHKLTKINVITQNPPQLLQFDELGNKRLILDTEPLTNLLTRLNLNDFLTNDLINFENSGYEVVVNKPWEDWTKLKRHEIAMFRDGEKRYYGLHGDDIPYELPELSKELYDQLQEIGEHGLFVDGCRTQLSWHSNKQLIQHVLQEVEKNGHLYQRKSVLKALSRNEEALYALHTAIIANGGKPLYNSSKVSLVFQHSAIEQRAWRVVLNKELPEENFKKTLLIVTSIPAIYQYAADGIRSVLVEGEACKEAFTKARSWLLECDNDYDDLIHVTHLDPLNKLNNIILEHNGQSILAAPDHPVINLLKQFDTVEMVREQSWPMYLKSVVFTFPRSEVDNILQAFKLYKSDADELYELKEESERNMVLC